MKDEVEASGKLRDGDGRNARMTAFIGELVAAGVLDGAEMSERINAFQEAFFAEPLEPREIEATLRSIVGKERRDHPDRMARHVAKIEAPAPRPPAVKKGFLTLSELAAWPVRHSAPLLDPLLGNEPSIAQVYGFSGAGKSWLLKHILCCAALARPFGPFVPSRMVRTLYLDFENGTGTLAERAQGLIHAYGDPGDAFMVHAASVHDNDIILNSPSGPRRLEDLLKVTEPDLVVFDTVRSAWPGIEENKAEAWAPVNTMASSIRAVGCHVVLVHHGNKPSEQNPHGSEAGNTAQLTMLDTQMSVQALYKDEETAKARRGACWPEGKRDEYESSLNTPQDRLAFGWKVAWGKDRDANLNRRVYHIGMAETAKSGQNYPLCDLSPRQDVCYRYFHAREDMVVIARETGYSLPHVRKWLLHECERRGLDPESHGL